MSDTLKARMEKYLADLIGPVGSPDTIDVEYGAVRRMALAVDDLDPIHFDHDAAVARGYRGIVAPWPYLWLLFFDCTPVLEEPPFGKATVHGQDDYEFHEPIIVGDVVTSTTAISDARVKEGKAGLLGMIVEERRFTNQRDELCAVLKTTLFRR